MAVVATVVIGATVGAPEVDRAGACLDPMAVTDNPAVRARTGRTASRAESCSIDPWELPVYTGRCCFIVVDGRRNLVKFQNGRATV